MLEEHKDASGHLAM